MGIHKSTLRFGQLPHQRIDRLLIVISTDNFADFRLRIQFSGSSAALRPNA